MHISVESSAAGAESPFEIVERKGIGHPDTICDLVSERFSVALSRYYLEHFGAILHHNVDKALLVAGRALPAFGGGRVVKPIDLYLAGRATADVGGVKVPVAELAEEVAASWFREHLHAFDVAAGLRLRCVTEPGSADLVDLFGRSRREAAPLANDTSVGVGYAPASRLERIVRAVAGRINGAAYRAAYPETGEDIKVMGSRTGSDVRLTVSSAMIGRYLPDREAYRQAVERLAGEVRRVARDLAEGEVAVTVNAADNPASGKVYLTVGGTSAECGDDGQVGRGNRASGLITPFRPMTLEAVAGKNPVTHVGKLYTAAAFRIAEAVVAECTEVARAACFLLSEIGRPVDEPQVAHVRVETLERAHAAATERQVRDIAEREIAGVPSLWRGFLSGAIGVA